jgi:hypothetical protein
MIANGLTLPTKEAEARLEAEITRMVSAPYCDPGPGGFCRKKKKKKK